MKPVSKKDEQKPTYPNRRDFIRRVGMAAAGVGLGALGASKALAQGPRIAGARVAPRPEKKKAFCAETCGKEIDAQIKLLGSKDFKVRKQATAVLIAIGTAKGEDKKVAGQKRALLVARLEKLKTAKDPEIVQRAKLIITAVTPKKKAVPVRPPVGIAGGIRAH